MLARVVTSLDEAGHNHQVSEEPVHDVLAIIYRQTREHHALGPLDIHHHDSCDDDWMEGLVLIVGLSRELRVMNLPVALQFPEQLELYFCLVDG